MAIRVSQPAILLAAGLALSGCIDVECPPEFDRPISRERYCGHTGDVAMPVKYQVYPTAQPLPPDPHAAGATTVTTTTVTTAPPAPQAAPAPGAPTPLR
jgi:hypothetical protein